MDQKRKLQFEKIEKIEKLLREELDKHGIKLHNIEVVVPFVETDFNLSIVFFFEAKKDLSSHSKKIITKIWRDKADQEEYFKHFPDTVHFDFDTYENVKKNYEGSYFYRMR